VERGVWGERLVGILLRWGGRRRDEVVLGQLGRRVKEERKRER